MFPWRRRRRLRVHATAGSVRHIRCHAAVEPPTRWSRQREPPRRVLWHNTQDELVDLGLSLEGPQTKEPTSKTSALDVRSVVTADCSVSVDHIWYQTLTRCRRNTDTTACKKDGSRVTDDSDIGLRHLSARLAGLAFVGLHQFETSPRPFQPVGPWSNASPRATPSSASSPKKGAISAFRRSASATSGVTRTTGNFESGSPNADKIRHGFCVGSRRGEVSQITGVSGRSHREVKHQRLIAVVNRSRTDTSSRAAPNRTHPSAKGAGQSHPETLGHTGQASPTRRS